MKLTRTQAAIIGAFTGVTFGPFVDICRYAGFKLTGVDDPNDFPGPFTMMEMANRLSRIAEGDYLRLIVKELPGFTIDLKDAEAIIAMAPDENDPGPDFSHLTAAPPDV